MTKYCDLKCVRDKLWSCAYRYKVYNVRIVQIHLKQDIPSHLSIAGNATIITYDGQPPTCFKCNETGHQQINCPRRNRLTLHTKDRRSVSWADVVANTSRSEMPGLEQGIPGPMSNPEVQDLTEHQDITGIGGQGPSNIGTFQACLRSTTRGTKP